MATKVKFVVDAQDRTKAALSAANRRLVMLRKTAGRVTSGLGGMHAKIGLLIGTAGLGALTAKSFKTIDALAKTADSLGITTQKLAGLQHAANISGVSSESLTKALQRMQQGLGQVASTGSGEAKYALEQLGISIEDIKDLKPDEQFKLIASQLKNVENQSQKVYIAQSLLGREGRKLINTMNLGAEGIEALTEDAEKLGLAVNRLDAAKIEAANDAFDRAKKAVDGVGNKLAVELAPIIKVVSDRFVEAATSGNNMSNAVHSAFSGGAKVAGVFADGIHGIKIIIKGAEVAIRGFGFAGAAAFRLLVDGVVMVENRIRSFVSDKLQPAIDLANELGILPDKMARGWEQFQKSQAKTPEGIVKFADEMANGVAVATKQLQGLLMSDLPSAIIKQKLAGVIEAADEEAKKIVAKVNENTGNIYTDTGEDASDNTDEVDEVKSNEEKILAIKIRSSKKFAAVQTAIKLKQALVNAYTGISEAVASAPFPLNVPAIAFATAQGFANVQAIRGARQHGGAVKAGESYEVGEKGREVFTPTRSGIITRNQDIADGNGLGSQQNIALNLNVAGNVTGGFVEEFMANQKQIVRMLKGAIGAPI